MKISELITETASAGATGSGSIATTNNGFASGGIGTISRNMTSPTKKKKKSKKS